MIGRRHVESASKSAPFTPCVSLPRSAARRIPTVIVDTFRPQMAERRFEELEPLLAELEELVKEEEAGGDSRMIPPPTRVFYVRAAGLPPRFTHDRAPFAQRARESCTHEAGPCS
jgi:hypothetical protein